ncbi:MAG: sigma-70 family RNA polymerase sigma factor [Bacteroidia bacterium]|nr:sigma-70 family RNA polymerase sigma factor [Bacteroidia bacterium]
MTREEFKARFLPLSDGLYRIALHFLEDDADAQDAVQDVFIKLWKSRDKLDSIKNPEAYSYTLIKNICIDRLRRARKNVLSGELEERSGDDPPDKELSDREALRKTLACIEELPEKQREIVRMRIFEELEYDEIAEKLGISEINTRVQLSLARKALKSRMRNEL